MPRYHNQVLRPILILPFYCKAQLDESNLGAWTMYFWNTIFYRSTWGLQGAFQYRNWKVEGDLEQLLWRSGLTYQPSTANIKFTLGYAHVTVGTYGDSDESKAENPIHREALLPQKVGSRFYLTYCFRYEQRLLKAQDLRTRWRCNLFINVPFHKKDLSKNAVYVAFYNQLFINGQRDTIQGKIVEVFDRNRAYLALGYRLTDALSVQAGYTIQITDSWEKRQLQLTLTPQAILD